MLRVELRVLSKAECAAAKAQGKSLNAWITETVEEVAGKTVG